MNLIFSSGNYPSNWSRNLLVAIHKSGAKDDPDNYRGISISSCLSKLCSTVLYLRVLEVNESFSLINNKQIGFLKGYRTSDHILLIDTIIHEIVHKCKQRLFVAFIDLKKAYDKVNRNALLCKLRSKGFSGKFLNIIKAMLINVVQVPKINGKLLSQIVTKVGLKQGDNLSPILFNIFFDDVEEIFDTSCDPVILTDELSINHLLYADDMAILSLSSDGLQNSLDKLKVYCDKWHLELNTTKTKIIVFSTTGRPLKGYRFSYDGKILEQVREFKYLGTTLSGSGSLMCAKEKLRKQANKAYFPMLNALHKIDFEALPSLHLFDSLIRPILNYNCEVWNKLTKRNIVAIRKGEIQLENLYFDFPAEKMQLQICRNILGVSKKTSVLASLGELGRYPLMLSCCVQMVKYWHRIKTDTPDTSLINKILSYMEEKEDLGEHSWISTVKFLLDYCNMNDIWLNPTEIKNDTIASKCCNILMSKYVDFWNKMLQNTDSSSLKKKKSNVYMHGNNKLRTYCLIKNEYRMEAYLTSIANRTNRKMLAKLRCSNHPLLIEVGRHLKMDVDTRKCNLCDRIEDEIHFVTECQLYTETRNKFLSEVGILHNDCTKTMFVNLLTSKNEQLIQRLAQFITNCFEIRSVVRG